MQPVVLHPGYQGGRLAFLRELRGSDEIEVQENDTHTFAATDLLDRLLVEHPEVPIGPGVAWDLALCDRDRLLAAVYEHHFGDGIESSMDCRQCGEKMDISFSLSSLRQQMQSASEESPGKSSRLSGPNASGVYDFQAEEGKHYEFRLPTTRDQRAVVDVGDHQSQALALLDRCLLGQDVRKLSEETREEIQKQMERVGPVFELELDAECPECQHGQDIHFNLHRYLLQTILGEKRNLNHEVHSIARSYGWALNEILDLPRSTRKEYVRLIRTEDRKGRWTR